jgi:hypothetical protein
MLSLVVLSHRHNKEESITKKKDKYELDFSIVRDTMYKYSKKVQERFFKNSPLAFLFIAFAASPEGMDFINQKFNEKGQDYLVRMYAEMSELRDEAIKSLKSTKSDASAKLLLNFLIQSFSLI